MESIPLSRRGRIGGGDLVADVPQIFVESQLSYCSASLVTR